MRSMLVVVLLGLAGCTTTDRGAALRDQIRMRAGQTWNERWQASQARSELWRFRFELCMEARQGADIAPMTPQAVEAACSSDARTLESAPTATPEDFTLAAKWAREVMRDERLAGALGCRASEVAPNDVALQLACADTRIADKEWSKALPLLLKVFERGSPAQQCGVVRRIDLNSPSPAQDAAGLSLDVVRRCRAEAEIQPTASGAGTPPPPSERPAASVSPARGAPASAEEAPVGHLQLEGDLQTLTGAGLGSTGIVSSFGTSLSIGYAAERYVVSVEPGFSYSTVGTGNLQVQASSLSLALSARVSFADREVGALVPYVRPEAFVGLLSTGTGAGGSFAVTLYGVGAAAGGEYLITPRLGVVAALGLRLTLSADVNLTGLATTPMLGVVLRN